MESDEEFTVITNGLAAEYGRTGGGVITSATRSGTNQFRGAAYGYIRRDELNANSWTNKQQQPAAEPPAGERVRVQPRRADPEGQDVLLRQRVERQKSVSPDDLILTVPTLRQRSGDFSDTRTSSGQLITIYDPATTRPNPAGGYLRDPFPGNVIPANRIDPISQQLLKYYPLPTNDAATNNFVQARSRTSSSLPIVARLDHYWGRHHLFAAFRQTGSEDSSDPVDGEVPGPRHQRRAWHPGQRPHLGRPEPHSSLPLEPDRRVPRELHPQPVHLGMIQGAESVVTTLPVHDQKRDLVSQPGN